MKLFGRKIKFGDPEQADIVIFDECNSHIVRKVINGKYHIAIFNQRPENIWIGFGVFFQFLYLLFRVQLKEASEHKRGLIIGVLKQIRNRYFEACLVMMKPKAVVTYIDNNGLFGWLSKHNRDFPFIAIQNGGRLSYASSADAGYYCQHLFCFGEHERNLFQKIGYQVENFYPVGSLVASLHFDRSLTDRDIKYELLVVSSWRGNIGFPKDVQDTMRSMRIMDELLARYIRSRGVKAAAILRVNKESEHWTVPEIGMSEGEYFQTIYGDSLDIIDTVPSIRNVFPLMQQSTNIVSCLSTALLEAYGIGKKILYCNFTDTDLYHSDLDSKIVTDQSSWDMFSLQLDELLSRETEDYKREHKETMQYYMSFPPNSTTHELITSTIDKIIKDNHVAFS
jgi:surface carbohydrate biosynthesis protein